MKPRVWLALFGLALSSCHSSWSPESVERTKNLCVQLTAPMEGDSLAHEICNCYVQKLVERHPGNDQTPEDIQPIINECSEEHPRYKIASEE